MATDQLTRTFAALADPTRRAILTTLRERGEASVTELATPFELTPRAISKHIGVLESAGLVSRGRDAQRRPSRLRVEPLVEVDAWLEDYRATWEHRFTALEADLAADDPHPDTPQADTRESDRPPTNHSQETT